MLTELLLHDMFLLPSTSSICPLLTQLVDGDMVCHPKEVGGLSILGLARFGLAGFPSTTPDRSWGPNDMDLFRTVTTVTIGDSMKDITLPIFQL